MKTPSFIKNWDASQKAAAVKIIGLCMAALAIFVLVASVSYLAHWQQDMSFEPGEKVANAAGTLGYRTGKFLVGDFLGLGSFALLIILVVLSVRLLVGKWIMSPGRTLLLTLSGAFVSSLLLAFAGSVAGLGTAFGGGLGGACGAAVVEWSIRIMGHIITALVILLLVVIWLFIAVPPFNEWLAGLCKSGRK